MSGRPNLWHLLQVGQMEAGDRLKYGIVESPEECGCTPEAPCPTLSLYFGHQFLPGALRVGQYRMRINAFGLLEVETTEEPASDSPSWRAEAWPELGITAPAEEAGQ